MTLGITDLSWKIQAFLSQLPSDETLTSKEVLECALDIDLVDRSEEAKALFHTLRRLANGSLSHFVTRGPPYTVRGQTRRSYIWHSRPQVPPRPSVGPNNQLTDFPDFTELNHQDDMNALRESLARIETALADTGVEILEERFAGVEKVLERIEQKLERLLKDVHQLPGHVIEGLKEYGPEPNFGPPFGVR